MKNQNKRRIPIGAKVTFTENDCCLCNNIKKGQIGIIAAYKRNSYIIRTKTPAFRNGYKTLSYHSDTCFRIVINNDIIKLDIFEDTDLGRLI